MGAFGLSEIQSNAILDMRLQKLTGLERQKMDEYRAIMKLIGELEAILESEEKVRGIIAKELRDIKEKYGDPRRTEIVADEGEMDIEDLIANEACIVTISHQGYLKRTAVTAYRSQRRGGKGVIGMEQREEDFIEHLFTCSTHDNIMFFTESGRVYVEKVYELPEMGRMAISRVASDHLPVIVDLELR